METGAIAFWVLSWGFVLGLTAWAFGTILKGKRHFDPDGIGPDVPPEPGRAETREPRR